MINSMSSCLDPMNLPQDMNMYFGTHSSLVFCEGRIEGLSASGLGIVPVGAVPGSEGGTGRLGRMRQTPLFLLSAASE